MSAKVEGTLGVSHMSVLGILEEEGRKAVRTATTGLAREINAGAPVGPTGRLSKSHRASVRKTPDGVEGTIKRKGAWYGRVVSQGRQPGTGRTGRKYPAAKANPYFEASIARHEPVAERLLIAGADKAADRIEARLRG